MAKKVGDKNYSPREKRLQAQVKVKEARIAELEARILEMREVATRKPVRKP